MEAKRRMEERIWAYMDGLLDGKEKAAVEKLLYTDPAWKKCHDSLRDLDRTLHSVSLEEPSMRFTKNVMEQITSLQVAPATGTYVNKRIIYGIGGFFLLLITATLAYVIPQLDFSQTSPEQFPVKLPSMEFDWSRYVNSTTLQVFFILDTVAALFFLDRYLQRKKTGWQSGTAK
jgi:hypothetical protein